MPVTWIHFDASHGGDAGAATILLAAPAAAISLPPLTGVCNGCYVGGMMGHLQVGLWSGFGQQLGAAPGAVLEQQTPEPVDAGADHADGVRRTGPRVAMIESQRFGRRPQAAWVDATALRVLYSGAVG